MYLRSESATFQNILRYKIWQESGNLSLYTDVLQARRTGFESRQGYVFFRTSRPVLGAHPASHPMGTVDDFSVGKVAGT
jgi:hypothetical protein